MEASALGGGPAPRCKWASSLPRLRCSKAEFSSPEATRGRAWLPRWRWWRGQKYGEGEEGIRRREQGRSSKGGFIMSLQPKMSALNHYSFE